MESLEQFLAYLNSWVWGKPLLAFLLGTGLYLTCILKGVQFRYLSYAFKQIFSKQKSHAAGDINPYEALMTSLAGAIGTGAIVGISTAVVVGGLGALFWMWVTAFLGMATKYAESLLAVKYRMLDQKGEMSGGPMQYIEKGLGWKKLAAIFAIFGAIASLGTGNLVQVNSIAEAAQNVWSINPWVSGTLLAFITMLVILGGVRTIGHVTGILVPFMSLFYVVGGLLILLMHAEKLPSVFLQIFKTAFYPESIVAGTVGSAFIAVVQIGVSRSVFSNEAGLGISSIAAAAAKTDSPGRQGLITMTGALISTVIVCSITGLVLAVTGVLEATGGKQLTGASLAIQAFSGSLWGGSYIVSIGLILFAFSTVLAWAYYGEKCFEYLFGKKAAIYYRILYCLIVIPGAALKLETVWYLADITNGLMIIPNLVALIGLSHVLVKETNDFILELNQEKLKLKVIKA